MVAPLAIIQARLHSTRLPNKMLLPLGGHPLLWWAWDAAWDVFDHVVIACPLGDQATFQQALPHATVFGWDGPEWDVLGRLHACAHEYAYQPDTPIVRITPDDFPIDVFRERCTLAQLDVWHASVTDRGDRENVGNLFPGRREINDAVDYEAVKAYVESHEREYRPPV